MRNHCQAWIVAALLTLSLSACQQPDVGQSCQLTGQLQCDANVTGDYLQTGSTGCENLVCLCSQFQAGSRYQGAFCSKPCVSDADCFQSETGLVCRQVVLDPTFLASLSDATRQQYLGDIQRSSYCAVPK